MRVSPRSVQRRHQKIIEESPAPELPDSVRHDLWSKARAAALAVGYEGAGTVEFIFDNATGSFFFMEMNTRLQVEHPVTELVTGQDLVRWQLLVAEGHPLPLTQDEVEAEIAARGHAFEARIYAENPAAGFLPDSGSLLHLRTPADARVDAGFIAGDDISPHYDPMIAKLIVGGPDRRTALLKLRAALSEYEVAGMSTNIEFLKDLCDSPDFQAGVVETGYIAQHRDELFPERPLAPEVLVQAALGLLLQEQRDQPQPAYALPAHNLGFNSDAPYATRTVHLTEPHADPSQPPGPATPVTIRQTSPGTFTADALGTTFDHVAASLTGPTALRAFYPHTRLDATLIRAGDDLTLFQRGAQFRLRVAPPAWAGAALGTPDAANSVLAPMPCKVLRVEVREGERVVANQALVVIESMKMETVIRSPGEGLVERVVHKAGDICKAGTALVEFATEDS